MTNQSHFSASKIIRWEEIQKIPEVTLIHHISNKNEVIATKGRSLLVGDERQWKQWGKFPFSLPRDLFGFTRPTARIMRSDKCNVYQNAAGNIIGIRSGKVYDCSYQGALRYLFNIQGDCILHKAICEDDEGWSYFGEYFMNPQRNQVQIWKIAPDLKTWEIAYSFPANTIRHVHGVYRDPHEKESFWITVGDFENECYFFKTDNKFHTLKQYGNGSQQWRAVNLFFTEHSINWISDSHLQQNFAFRMDRKGGKLEIGQPITNSGWYGVTTAENLHLAFTTVERGPAISSDRSQILISEDAYHWEEIFSYKKDFWRPMRLFKYGVIIPPSGNQHIEKLYLSGEGLSGLDGSGVLAKIHYLGKK